MDLELATDVAVVVGGARGIGHAIAVGFANEGARVVVIDRADDTVDVANEIVRAAHVDALGIVADVTDYAALQRAADEVLARFGRFDHVVFAAGIGSGKFGFPYWNLQPSDWPRVLDVCLMGAANVGHAFAPHLVKAGRGSFLYLSSVAGQIGSQSDPPYSAAKAGVINFAQCAAKDLGPLGVRVNVVCPGMIKTALNRSVWQAWHDGQPPELRLSYEQWADEKVRRVAPLGRWQEPQDIANVAVFLASPRARNITGQTVNVDGGQVMHA